MIKWVFLLLFAAGHSASALEQKSYQLIKSPFSIQLISSAGKINRAEGQFQKDELDDLIQKNLDKNWKRNPPKTKIDMIEPYKLENYAGGTGTRGGGSGFLVKVSEQVTEVKILEIFRSENLDQYNLYFPIDPDLRKIESSHSGEMVTQMIFEEVLQRISQVAPNLAAKIHHLYRVEMPFENWIPVFHDLPLVDDEVAYPLERNKSKIQIAYRRTQYIVYNLRAYAAMSPLNRAALWLHEYIYALSGDEKSVRTQRAVSLFFSSEFLSIASDIEKLTRLFYDLGLLAVSRKSIADSLPPGARLAKGKQIQNCGYLAAINGVPTSEKVELVIEINRELEKIQIHRSKAQVVLSALTWAKAFLEKAFPIYKFYGQKILADKICFSPMTGKITQLQSALAIDKDMAEATRNVALAEVELLKARSTLTELLERQLSHPAEVQSEAISEAITNLLAQQEKFLHEEKKFKMTAFTPIEKILHPKILGEHLIQIDD